MAVQSQAKILVIRGGAIGDFVLTLPVLAALRQQFPQVRLEVLGYAHIAQLALVGGLADAVRSIDARPLAGFFARNGILDSALQEYFAGFALIVSYLYDPDGIFQTNVARCSKAQFIAGRHRPNDAGKEHATATFLRPLERLAIFDAEPVPRLNLRQPSSPVPQSAANPQAHLSAENSGLVQDGREPVPVLAVHPGSGSRRKNWPEAKWAELLPRLLALPQLRLLLVGGEAEEGRLERLAAPLPPSRCEIARSLPLADLARRLGGCAGFLGHDSGITHLAAALGLPVLVLWGESVEEVWRPLGSTVTVLRDPDGIWAIAVEGVLEQVARSFPFPTSQQRT